jgi:hypothetical protein
LTLFIIFFCPPFLLTFPLALWCMLDPGLFQDQFPGIFIPWNYSAASNIYPFSTSFKWTIHSMYQ